jgi:hypothetical protein
MIFLVTISIAEVDAYSQLADAIAIQQVVNQGGKVLFLSPNAERFFCFVPVYVTVAMGNSGAGGLQTGLSPGDAPGAIAVASVDSVGIAQLIAVSPVNNKIFPRSELLSLNDNFVR